jgi:hypothetical protein
MSVYKGPKMCRRELILQLDAANPISLDANNNVWNDISGVKQDIVGSLNGTFSSHTHFIVFESDGNCDITYNSVQSLFQINGNTGLTISIAFRYFNAPQTATGVLGHFEDGYEVFNFLINSSSGLEHHNEKINISTSSEIDCISSWVILDFVYLNKTLNIYKNGTFFNTFISTNTWDSSLTATNFVIGGEGKVLALGGLAVGYVNVHNIDLTASEILQNYNCFKGRYGLV